MCVSAAIPPPSAAPSFGSSSEPAKTTSTTTTTEPEEEKEVDLPSSPAPPGVETASEPVEQRSPATSLLTPQFLIIQAELAVVSLIGAAMYFFGRKKEMPTQSSHPDNSNLKQYVHNMMQRGYNRQQLQQTLLAAGYEMSDIIEAFRP